MSDDSVTPVIDEAKLLAQLYVGYFNRPADPAGYTFWRDAYTDDGVSDVQMAALFSDQDETRALYPYFADPAADDPEQTNAKAFLTSVYDNLFNRTPDEAGLNFWLGVLTSGGNVGEIILSIIRGAQGDDITVMEHKVAAAQHWLAEATNEPGYTLTPEALATSRSVIDAAGLDAGSVGQANLITDEFFQDAPSLELAQSRKLISEGFDTTTRVKVADITIEDDAWGNNVLSLTGDDAGMYEIDEGVLYLKAGVALNFDSNPRLDVTVVVNDTTRDDGPHDQVDVRVGLLDDPDRTGDARNDTLKGSEFMVNAYTLANQYDPAVAQLDDGSVRFVWYGQRGGQEPDMYNAAIKTRSFDTHGREVDEESVANRPYSSQQYDPDIAALKNDGYAIVWESYDGELGDTSGTAINLRIFDEDGYEEELVRVNDLTTRDQLDPQITRLEGDNMVVVWETYEHSSDDTDVRFKVFSADGTALTNEGTIGQYNAEYQQSPQVTALKNGGFVAVWQSNHHNGKPPTSGQDASDSGIRARIYDEKFDAVGGEFLVNSITPTDQRSPDVVELRNGDLMFVWQSHDEQQSGSEGWDIKMRVMDDEGNAVTGEMVLNQHVIYDQITPEITLLKDGNVAIVWETRESAPQNGGDGNSSAIKGMVIKGDGEVVVPEFLVNEFSYKRQADPYIASLDDGGFVVTWLSNDAEQGGTSYDIKARYFEADGTPRETDRVLAVDETASIDFDDLLANDNIPEGETWTISAVSATSERGASLTLDAAGQSILYNPLASGVPDFGIEEGESKEDKFVYTVLDADGDTHTASVTFTVMNYVDQLLSPL